MSTTLAQKQHSLLDTGTLVENIATKSADDIRLSLESIEQDFGPFDARLGESLLSAGDLLAESGDYESAKSYFERALYINRLHQGLYHETHIAIVERLIECDVAAQDWESVNAHYGHLQFLYSRLYEKGSDKWIQGIAQVSDWHIVALNHHLGGDRLGHLRIANRLFRQRLTLAQEQGNVSAEGLAILQHNVDATAQQLRTGGESDHEVTQVRVFSRIDSRRHDADRSLALE